MYVRGCCLASCIACYCVNRSWLQVGRRFIAVEPDHGTLAPSEGKLLSCESPVVFGACPSVAASIASDVQEAKRSLLSPLDVLSGCMDLFGMCRAGYALCWLLFGMSGVLLMMQAAQHVQCAK